MADTAQLESQLDALLLRREQLQNELQQIATEFFAKVDQANALERAGNRGEEFQQLSAEIRQLRARRVAINQELAQVEQQITNIQSQINNIQTQERATANQGAPSASAGQTAANAQQGQQDGANTVDPPAAPDANSSLRPQGPVQAPTAGTDEPVKTGQNLQSPPSVPDNQGGPLIPAGRLPASTVGDAAAEPGPGVAPVNPGTQPGAFRTDDATRGSEIANRDVQRQQVDNLYGSNNIIQASQNVLSQYDHYTYNISWYLLPQNYFERLSATQTNTIPGYYLLAQSGGSATSASEVQTQQGTVPISELPAAGEDIELSSGRNPFFDVDFFLDNLEITTRYPGAGSRASHSVVELSFSIFEQYGISLLPRLYKAVADSYKTQGIDTKENFNYATALYALVIKFWGYKQDGTLERVRSSTGAPVEKFIPFVINDLRFTQGSKAIEYKISGRAPQTYVNFGSERGIALERYNLTGASVKDVLTGNKGATGTSANPGRTTADPGR